MSPVVNKRVLAFLRSWFQTHELSPSMRDIAMAIDRSTSVVSASIHELGEAGEVLFTPKIARSIRLPYTVRAAEMWHIPVIGTVSKGVQAVLPTSLRLAGNASVVPVTRSIIGTGAAANLYGLKVIDLCLLDSLILPGDTLVMRKESFYGDGSTLLIWLSGLGRMELRRFRNLGARAELLPTVRGDILNISKQDFVVHGVFVVMLRSLETQNKVKD